MASLASLPPLPPMAQGLSQIPDVAMRVQMMRQFATQMTGVADSMREHAPDKAKEYEQMGEQVLVHVEALEATNSSAQVAAETAMPSAPSADTMRLLGIDNPDGGAAAAAFDGVVVGTNDLDPYKAAIDKCYEQICTLCMDYAPPAYQTNVFTTDTPTPVPLLRHWIASWEWTPTAANTQGAAADADAVAAGETYRGPLAFTRQLSHQGTSGWIDTCTSKAMRDQFRALLDEVCNPAANTQWDATKSAVMLVAIVMASVSDSSICTAIMGAADSGSPEMEEACKQWQQADKDEKENGTELEEFHLAQSIVEKHMTTITAGLEAVEAEMRASGDYERLLELVIAEEKNDGGGRLRQDRKDLLGSHPTFLALKEAFSLRPVAFPGQGEATLRGSHLYYWGEDNAGNTLLQALDNDLRECVAYNLAALQKAAKGYDVIPAMKAAAEKIRMTERCALQPYVLWLLQAGRDCAPVFHDKLRSILPSSECYQAAPLKGLQRCQEKLQDDYHFLDGFALPTGACLLDVVRGLVVSPTVDHMVDCFHRICSAFEVLRVKNGFCDADAKFGFRQILMNVRCEGPGGAWAMSCEVQLNLASYVKVKHQIHKFYSLMRCEKPTAFNGLVTKRAMPF